MRVTPSEIPYLRQRSRNELRVFIQRQRAIDRAVGMIPLLAGSAEQHVQGIANDLCNRTIVRKHKISHAGKIIIEQRPKHFRLERLHQRSKAGNVAEQSRNFASLSSKSERVRFAGEPQSQIGREIPRQRGMRPLGFRLPPPRLPQNLNMPDGLGNRRFEIAKIDGLGQKVKGSPVHRSTNIGHVAIGRDDDGRDLFFVLLQLLEKGKSVHPRHVDVGNHHVDIAVFLQRRQGFDTVTGEQKTDGSVANLVAELLLDERLQVRLVVDNQNLRSHAALSTRVSISSRSMPKSIGLVRSASAPRSSAWRFVSGIAIGGDHDDRNVRSQGLRLGKEFQAAHPRHIDVGQDQDK